MVGNIITNVNFVIWQHHTGDLCKVNFLFTKIVYSGNVANMNLHVFIYCGYWTSEPIPTGFLYIFLGYAFLFS